MNIVFEEMAEQHRKDVIDIYNHYILTSFAAYPDTPVSYEYYDRFMEMTSGFPAYVIKVEDVMGGFCFFRPYKPLPTFSSCAEITYFLRPEHRRRGLGAVALARLEAEARARGIDSLLASIASENRESLLFHEKHGFRRCGNFKGIIAKFDKRFDMIWMQKFLQ